MSFHDHFSGHATLYASARPSYPPELFDYLSSQCVGSDLAIDCACGNGQASRSLLKYFETVLMIDASVAQLQQYASAGEGSNKAVAVVALAERLPVADECADLLTVAQALHWFDFDSFCEELDRVLKPGSLFAAWSYGIHSIAPDIDAVIGYLYEDLLGEYWTPERRSVEDGYAGYDFPFQEVPAPSFKLRKCWSIEHVLAYLNSWSAVQRYQQANDSNPVDSIVGSLTELWGGQVQREVQWPLTLKVRRKP